VGKLLAPTEARALVEGMADLEPLLRALEAPDTALVRAGQAGCRHLVGSLLESQANRQDGPWSEVLARVSRRLDQGIVYAVQALLYRLTRQIGDVGMTQDAALGIASRSLLTYALEQKEEGRPFLHGGTEAICRTFGSDPMASAEAIRQLL